MMFHGYGNLGQSHILVIILGLVIHGDPTANSKPCDMSSMYNM